MYRMENGVPSGRAHKGPCGRFAWSAECPCSPDTAQMSLITSGEVWRVQSYMVGHGLEWGVRGTQSEVASGCCVFALGQLLCGLACSLVRWGAQNEMVPNGNCGSPIPGTKQNYIRRCHGHTSDLFSHLTRSLTDLRAGVGGISYGLESRTYSSRDLSDLVHAT